jgi:hypothetical protein
MIQNNTERKRMKMRERTKANQKKYNFLFLFLSTVSYLSEGLNPMIELTASSL